MALAAERNLIPFEEFDRLREARDIIRQEADALQQLATNLDQKFGDAAELLLDCRGSLIVTGMGKAGWIGRKVSATLASTGTPSHFLHPGEAIHGDLGCLRPEDVVLAFSNSGETEELCRLLPIVKRFSIPVISITATNESTLALQSDVVIAYGRLEEVGPHGLPPSTSTTAMLAIGDALAFVAAKERGLTPEDFATYHPGGSLGRKLTPVFEIMREGDDLRIASEKETVREVFARFQNKGRRTGAVILCDDSGRLSGLFTDSDLARLLEKHQEKQLDRPISEVMTHEPKTVQPETLLANVVHVLQDRKISELPVVDEHHRPLGLVDITDVIGLMPTG